ncbi:hypothetical protein [Citromicrobium bathyomarinum]|uniref:hypothetical protein n=1 Tax=Citromicrobium bathyomarinum TaxID=72174 RepID=UPI00315A8F8E
MKPQSMKVFDYAYLGSIFLGLLQFVSGYGTLKAEVAAQSATSGVALSPLFPLAAYAAFVAVELLLWFLVSRKRVIIAKWIIVLFFLLSLVSVGGYFVGPMPLSEIYGLLSLIAQAVAVAMLFRGDSIRWLNGRNAPGDPQG